MSPIGPGGLAGRTMGTTHRNRRALRDGRVTARGVIPPASSASADVRSARPAAAEWRGAGVGEPRSVSIDGEDAPWRTINPQAAEATVRPGCTGPGSGSPTRSARGAPGPAHDRLIELMRPAVQADGGRPGARFRRRGHRCGRGPAAGGLQLLRRQRVDPAGRGRADPARSAGPGSPRCSGGVDESVDPFESESMGRGGYVPSF